MSQIAPWLAFAALVHGGLYYAARQVSDECQTVPPETDRWKEERLVMVAPEPLMEPPVTKEPETKEEPLPEKPEVPSVLRQQSETRSKKQIEKHTKQRETPDPSFFRDVGTIGSLHSDAVGTGDSGFTVAVGNSGVGGRIGTGGRATGKAAPRGSSESGTSDGTGRGLPPPVSNRDLSRKAKPKDAHNRKLKAPYPPHLREANTTGSVRALLTVKPDGKVRSVKILSATEPAFADATKKIFMKFMFSPALDRNGRAVTSEIRITYRFTLE